MVFYTSQIGIDWWGAVQHDIVELGLDLSLSEIQTMSEESFKNKVKTHASAAALVWLNSEKEKSKKVGHIQYSEIHIQNYLNSENLTVSQKKILTHLRGKMIKLRANFPKCMILFIVNYVYLMTVILMIHNNTY